MRRLFRLPLAMVIIGLSILWIQEGNMARTKR
ncbi:hypothetical protein PAECIP111893_05352 [Paenibacillus plantiphilus]|uniref:Uncharacterized protein n=1 Tax=Paenibacillus plantiphilus TaxID=2905650 RepID=A0ABN8H3N4_9BACL|nr:hypothetical protein PAECIP111893_05352 [Paenibacillus plantiphilus]